MFVLQIYDGNEGEAALKVLTQEFGIESLVRFNQSLYITSSLVYQPEFSPFNRAEDGGELTDKYCTSGADSLLD